MEEGKSIARYVATHRKRFLEELCSLIAIESVSSDPTRRQQMAACAARLQKLLVAAGADRAEVVATDGHPVVVAEKRFGADRPTVIVYGHYDVQPPDPLDVWQSSPFVPEIRDNAIYGRGASDDKGQLFTHLKALEYLVRNGRTGCNIIFVIEGEEEIGSPSLPAFFRSRPLAADAVLVSDTAMLPGNRPAITVGLRGLAAVEVEVRGPDRDLHSGIYGGAVVNPANALAAMIAGLHDAEGRITVPGLYDDVEEPDAAIRQQLAEAAPDDESVAADIGLVPSGVESGYTAFECTTIRPALDVNGIEAGHTGEGFKTVLPAVARARISVRLVPRQNSERVTRLLADHLHRLAPPGVRVTVRPSHGAEPVVVRPDFPALTVARRAMAAAFGQEVLCIRSGGSIPVVALFEKELGLQSVLMGFGQDSDAIHSPNEHFGLDNLERGIVACALFYEEFGRTAGAA